MRRTWAGRVCESPESLRLCAMRFVASSSLSANAQRLPTRGCCAMREQAAANRNLVASLGIRLIDYGFVTRGSLKRNFAEENGKRFANPIFHRRSVLQ